MSDFETLRKYIEAAASKDKMIELESFLTALPAMAPESGGNGESTKCSQLKKWLTDSGFEEEQFSQYDAEDERVESKKRPNLILTIPGKSDDFSIWIMAHMDVVPPGDLKNWKTDPWKAVYDEESGKIYGRGVEDNQQGLASAVLAALALKDEKITPAHTVKLLFMADEEFGSEYGVKFLLREHQDLFKKQDLILIPDGGDSKGETIEIAEKNILWLKLHTTGLQSHGSMPDKGKNAHLAAADLALRLNDLENFFGENDTMFEPPYSTFQPTKSEANVETVNIIPGDDTFYMDCRILPRYTLETVRKEVNKRVKAVEEKYGVKIEVSEAQASESPATPADAPVVQRLSKAIKTAHGIEAKLVGIGGGTVGAEFRNLGYNAAIWSTLDEVCHQPNEYCYVKNIIADAVTMAALFTEE